jgi:hypothetical protein
MIKEILTLRAFSNKLNKLGIASVKSFLEHCEDPKNREDLRRQLDVNVTPEQWDGAVAVVKELFK